MKILIASSIDESVLEELRREYDVEAAFNASEEQLREAAADREVLIFRSGVRVSSLVMAGAPRLQLMIRAGSGLDNVDVAHARIAGIRLLRVAGSSAQPVAELTFALMLALARKVSRADALLRQGHWPKAKLSGPLLHGKTLGVVGAGNIGARVGEMGALWGMRAIGCVATPGPAISAELSRRGVELVDFATVLKDSDFLCLHVPLDASTRHMIGEQELRRMKPGSFVVNMARGGVLDESALLCELTRGGPVAGAALDVHEQEGEGTVSPFAELPNVVLTPHIGAMATDSQRLIGQRVHELVAAFADGRLGDVSRPHEIVA